MPLLWVAIGIALMLFLLLAMDPMSALDIGFQLSFAGLLGLTLARAEGLELNLLGLVIGLDPSGPALKLPGIGRLGFS